MSGPLYKRLRAWVESLLPRSAFMRNVAVLASGTAVGQLLLIVTAPVLTRLYSPANMGVLEVYSNIVALLLVVATLRYEVAIPLPKDDEDGASLLAVAVGVALIVAPLSGILLYAFAGQIVAWTGAPALRHYLWLMPVAVLGAGAYNALNYWYVRHSDFSLVSRTRVIRGVVQVVLQIGFGLLRWGALGLLLGFAGAQFAGNGSLYSDAWRKHRAALRKITWRRCLDVAHRYRDFPRLASLAALLNIAPKQIPGLLMAAFYGVTAAGLFSISQRVIRVPATMLSTSISQVYMSRAAKVAQEDPKGLPRIFYKAAGRLFLLGIGPAVVLMIAAPWMTSVAFGGRWQAAGVYIQLVTPALLLEFIVSTLSPIIYIVERQAWQVTGDIIRFVVIAAAFYVAHALSSNPYVAIAAYSGAMVVTYLGFFALYGYAVKWRARVGFPAGSAGTNAGLAILELEGEEALASDDAGAAEETDETGP